jgi:hypothetical protein
MVRPIMMGISRLCKTLDVEPLDKEESESGTIAWSALMYQAGGMLDARVLVLLWVAGVSLPRALDYFEKREAKRRHQKLMDAGLIPPSPLQANSVQQAA